MRTAISFMIAMFSFAGAAVAAPAAGDTYVYRVINGYNNEVVGQVSQRVDKVEGGQIFISVSPDRPSLGLPRTDIVAADGNWLRHPLINHDVPVEYTFSPPYPAVLSSSSGNSWSTRVNATNPATGRHTSVRVDGDVVGNERITTPAGSFDTVRVKRRSYAGDWEPFKNETNIDEVEWFAPALGRPVKTERKSGYYDQQRCATRGACTLTRGDWFVYELVSHGRS